MMMMLTIMTRLEYFWTDHTALPLTNQPSRFRRQVLIIIISNPDSSRFLWFSHLQYFYNIEPGTYAVPENLELTSVQELVTPKTNITIIISIIIHHS